MRPKVGFAILASVSAVLVAILIYNNEPHYETRAVPSETFVLQPGLTQPITGNLFNGGNVATVHIQALSPVTVGFVPSASLDDATGTAAIQVARCRQERVLDATVTCELSRDQPFWLFVIRDERTAAGAVGSGIAAALGIRNPSQTYLVRNDVTLGIQAVVCTANCPQQ
jgi:hypothetical protein